MFHWFFFYVFINFFVLIVFQDLFLIAFRLLFWVVVHEHRMQEYPKYRVYQMNIEFISKMQTN